MLEIRTKKKFLAVDEIYMAIFRPNSGFQRRIFVSSGSSAEAVGKVGGEREQRIPRRFNLEIARPLNHAFKPRSYQRNGAAPIKFLSRSLYLPKTTRPVLSCSALLCSLAKRELSML